MKIITCMICGRLNPRGVVLARMWKGIGQTRAPAARYLSVTSVRCIGTSMVLQISRNRSESEFQLTVKGYFDGENRSKETFKGALEVFKGKSVHLRGHVEFIYAALKHMEEYGVHKDLEMYKNLLDLMPKGKMIPQNVFQAEFMHYPKQQQCAVYVLDQMEMFGVMPDTEMEMLLKNVFGRNSDPVRKFARMMYWMPKFKNASPWPVPFIVPNDAFELAQLAVARMCTVDPTSNITVYQTKDVEDAIDDTWIVSGMSPIQEELIAQHPSEEPVKVEGPFRIFLRDKCVGYFILRAEGKPPPAPPSHEEIDDVSNLKFWFIGKMDTETSTAVGKKLSVHEQEDGIIMAICATGTSSRDSLLSWIRLLQDKCPNLCNIPVLFTQASPIGDVMVVENSPDGEVEARR